MGSGDWEEKPITTNNQQPTINNQQSTNKISPQPVGNLTEYSARATSKCGEV
ncbi:MAG: hypothetical protein DSM106950_32010 [Stigonema ocellatum SAG 48.90 = DSM 106950]|nr:hypothetical protein [Stigonema ocellatum SAG 48.90 = DSM 106950]